MLHRRRQARVRRAVKAAANGRPRLSVFRSSKQIYAQIIDDAKGVTIAAASTLEKDLKAKLKTGADIAAATAVGKLVAERAVKAGVKTIVTDLPTDSVMDPPGDSYVGVMRALIDKLVVARYIREMI